MKPIFVKSFLTSPEAEALFASVQALAWTRGTFMGRSVPREEVWMGTYAYRFSGRALVPAGWTPEIEAVRNRILERYGGDFNSVLLNRYVNENDSVSWHSDDEPEMDSAHPIASLSLGAPRQFLIRPIEKNLPHRNARESYVLTSGSLLIMPPGFQQIYEHCVPKSKMPCGVRVNLTFRRMKPA